MTYVNERLGGFEVDTEASDAALGWARARRYLSGVLRGVHVGSPAEPHDLHRTDHLYGPRGSEADIKNLKAALQRVEDRKRS